MYSQHAISREEVVGLRPVGARLASDAPKLENGPHVSAVTSRRITCDEMMRVNLSVQPRTACGNYPFSGWAPGAM